LRGVARAVSSRRTGDGPIIVAMGLQLVSWRRLALIAPLGLLLSTEAAAQRAFSQPSREPPAAPAQIVVKLRDGADAGSLRTAPGVRAVDAFLADAVAAGRRSAARHAARDARGPDGAAAAVSALEAGFARTFVVRVEPAAIDATLARFRQDPGVEYAERDGVVAAQWTPNDPYVASSGSWGQPHADLYGLHLIRAAQAWDLTRGAGVVVAVTDTGIDWTHADLDGNVWVNADEIPGNGIDDDGNSYADDVRGWDFHYVDAEPMDRHGHGTHVAGIIAAEGNNADGIVGVAPAARVMAVQVLDNTGFGYYTLGAQGILYAVMNGADVVNASWGGSSASTLLEETVRYARARGVLFVTSAGNDGLDADYMPAAVPEAVTVAASNHLDRVPAFTNRGSSIDLTAPGAGILSLRASGVDPYGGGTHVVGGRYYWADGSSMAAAYVSGAAALLLSHFPAEKVDVTRDRLVFTADLIEWGNGDLAGGIGGGRLNLWRALTESLAPASLSISGRVVDRQGLPISGATVALCAMGSQRVVTSRDGRFLFSGLRPGGHYASRTWQLGVEFLPGQTYYAELAASSPPETVIGVRRWAYDPIDTTFAAGSAGLSLAMDAAGQARAAYHIPGFDAQLRYAVRTSQGWASEIVETAAASGAADVGLYSALSLDASGQPHIVYLRLATNGTPLIRYARREASGWVIEDVPATTSTWPPRMVLDAAGRPHVLDTRAYPAGTITHHWKDAGGWQQEVVIAGGYPYLVDAALDPYGRVNIAFQSSTGTATGPGFWRAVREPSGWQFNLADFLAFSTFSGSLGFAGGLPRLAYRYIEAYGVNPSVKYAAWDGAAWQAEVVDPSLFAFAVAHAEDVAAGGPLVVYVNSRGFATAVGLGGGGWYRTLLHRGLTGFHNDLIRDADGRARLAYTDWHTGFLWHARSLELLDPQWTPPVAALTAPAAGSAITGVVAVRATAQGPLGIRHVEILVDGVVVTTLNAAPYVFEWDTRTVSSGQHQLTARATDATGAVATHSLGVTVVNVLH
jgi:subtilisin family serine protease